MNDGFFFHKKDPKGFFQIKGNPFMKLLWNNRYWVSIVNADSLVLNTLRLRPGNVFKCIFWNENVSITIKISLMFVPNC